MRTQNTVYAVGQKTCLWLFPLIFALTLATWVRQVESSLGALPTLAPTVRYDASLALWSLPGETVPANAAIDVPRPLNLRRGQTLGALLSELGLEPIDTRAALAEIASHMDMRTLRPGEVGLAYFDPQEALSSLRLRSGQGWVDLTRSGAAWTSSLYEFEREVWLRRIEGRLENFLEGAIRRAGGAPQLAYAMSDILQWDLDFNRDLRIGDRFQVLYEEIYLDGESAGIGRILALVYENQGHRHEAFLYGDKDYYDAQGRPLQKMFLRSPLPFTRITSHFSHRRFHPVLKTHRPHYGVDFGAPRGTPVRVTASGVVTHVGRSGGAGNMVKVRHPNGYLTGYLHLSGYAKGLRTGQRVTQGQLIGYVGSTGWSTAPHLDYRVQKNGRWIDPLKLKAVPANPIADHELADFLARRDLLRSSLENGLMPDRRQELTASLAGNSVARG